MAYYKIRSHDGRDLHHFVKVDGDDTAERQVFEYVEGTDMTVELWNAWQAFQDEKVRDVPLSELRQRIEN